MEGRKSLLNQKKKLAERFARHYHFSKKVIASFKKIKRENFVLDELKSRSYDDEALRAVAGQTISQPSTVLYMLDLLDLKPGQKVLEIGAGSGYNAALISNIIGSKGIVYSIEFLNEVYRFAKKNIANAKIKNVNIIKGDGSKGYHKEAPYDRIIITAACPNIPSIMIEQLRSDGVIVAPVGSLEYQRMVRLKKKDGMLERFESDNEYLFVPLRGEYGFSNPLEKR